VTRVFVLDDQEFVRRSLKEMLEADGEVDVVGEAGTAEEARSSIPLTRPDVAVLDVRLPDGNGVEVCRDIRSQHPEIQCVMLSVFDDNEVVAPSIQAGASGSVLKQIKHGDILNAVRLVATGEVLFETLTTSASSRTRRRWSRRPARRIGETTAGNDYGKSRERRDSIVLQAQNART
jgi:two-component system response regulator DevR